MTRRRREDRERAATRPWRATTVGSSALAPSSKANPIKTAAACSKILRENHSSSISRFRIKSGSLVERVGPSADDGVSVELVHGGHDALASAPARPAKSNGGASSSTSIARSPASRSASPRTPPAGRSASARSFSALSPMAGPTACESPNWPATVAADVNETIGPVPYVPGCSGEKGCARRTEPALPWTPPLMRWRPRLAKLRPILT